MNNMINKIKGYFHVSITKEEQQQIIGSIIAGIRFRGMHLWVLIFAIFIASLGLNVNSTAVIIGAMLISPLMGPIMGLGLAIGISDNELLRKSLKNLFIMIVICNKIFYYNVIIFS